MTNGNHRDLNSMRTVALWWIVEADEFSGRQVYRKSEHREEVQTDWR